MQLETVLVSCNSFLYQKYIHYTYTSTTSGARQGFTLCILLFSIYKNSLSRMKIEICNVVDTVLISKKNLDKLKANKTNELHRKFKIG